MVGSNVKYGAAGVSTIIIVIIGVIVVPPLLFDLPEPSDEERILTLEERILRRVENRPISSPWLSFFFHYYERYRSDYQTLIIDEFDTILKPIFDEYGPKNPDWNMTTVTTGFEMFEDIEITGFDILDDCLENFNTYKEYYRPVIPPEFYDLPLNDTYDTLELSRAANLSAITQTMFQFDRQKSLSTDVIPDNPPVPITTPWGKIRGNSSPYIHSIKYQDRYFNWITTSIFPDANTDLESGPDAAAVAAAPAMGPGRIVELHGANFYNPSAKVVLYYWSQPNERWVFHSTATPFIVGDQTAPLDADWSDVDDIIYFWLPGNFENTNVSIGIQNDDPRFNPFTRDLIEGLSTDDFALIEIAGHTRELYQIAGRALTVIKQSEASADEIMAFGMADYNLRNNDQKIIRFFNIPKTMEVIEISPNQVDATILYPLPTIHRWILHKPNSWINPEGPVLVTFQIVDEDGGGTAESLVSDLVEAIVSAVVTAALSAIGLGWLGGLLDLLGVFDALIDLFSDPPDLLGDDRIVFLEDELFYLTSWDEDEPELALEDSPHYFSGRQTFDGLINTLMVAPGRVPNSDDHIDRELWLDFKIDSIDDTGDVYYWEGRGSETEKPEWQFSKNVRWYEGTTLVQGTAYCFSERRYYHHTTEDSTYLLLFDVMRKPAYTPVGG